LLEVGAVVVMNRLALLVGVVEQAAIERVREPLAVVQVLKLL
jgi:hypothetical protein